MTLNNPKDHTTYFFSLLGAGLRVVCVIWTETRSISLTLKAHKIRAFLFIRLPPPSVLTSSVCSCVMLYMLQLIHGNLGSITSIKIVEKL